MRRGYHQTKRAILNFPYTEKALLAPPGQEYLILDSKREGWQTSNCKFLSKLYQFPTNTEQAVGCNSPSIP